jgi:membrane-associated phospholipid phosphatase
VRKRVSTPPIVAQTVAFAAPLGLSVAMRRSRSRDVSVCALQMWAYLAAYKTPHDDQLAQRKRTRIDYPIAVDRVLGLGELPTVRLQRTIARWGPDGARWTVLDRILVWAHWMWFAVPHTALAYILFRHPRNFPRAAVMTYTVFDLGAVVYWLLPTAPPWYVSAAAENEHPEPASNGQCQAPIAPSGVAVRRMMVEYGEHFWGDSWGRLYSVFGGNPLAAMPSLHFGTSVMAALLLTEAEPLAGAVGWSYALGLGFALVYLGEHYVVDLIAGAALAIAVRRAGSLAGPVVKGAGRTVAALEARAQAP